MDLGSLYIDDKKYVKVEEYFRKVFLIGKEFYYFGIEFFVVSIL